MGSAILYAFLAPPWYRDAQSAGTFYNATSADLIWSVWAVALAALAIIAGLMRRRAQWALLVTAFGLFLLGHLLHLIYAEPQTHVAGWVRLAELCAYPLLAGLMILRAVERDESRAGRTACAGDSVHAVGLRLKSANAWPKLPNVNVALQRAGMAIGNFLGTDVLAIGLLRESGDTVELAAVCRARSEARSGPAFDVASQLPVHSAVSRQRALLVSADQELQHATLAALSAARPARCGYNRSFTNARRWASSSPGCRHDAEQPAGLRVELQMLDGLCDVLASALSVERRAAALAHQLEELKQRPVEPPRSG